MEWNCLPMSAERPRAELRITYLGRLHPIKGIENLLDACKLMEGDADPWHLTIAGSGEGDYPNVLRSKVENSG